MSTKKTRLTKTQKKQIASLRARLEETRERMREESTRAQKLALAQYIDSLTDKSCYMSQLLEHLSRDARISARYRTIEYLKAHFKARMRAKRIDLYRVYTFNARDFNAINESTFVQSK